LVNSQLIEQKRLLTCNVKMSEDKAAKALVNISI